ncbi:MAG: Flp pilus assembly protein CpaB [Tepidisphaeraceae bacterium]
MNVKKIAPLIVALVLGAIAAKMMFNFISSRQSNAEVKRPPVVLAKHNLDAGAVLTLDDLVLGDVASDAVPDTVFQSPDQLVGRVTVVPLIQGQAITSTLLAPRGVGPGLQAAVPNGMRAVSVDINEITGVAGYLVAGCHVDLIQTVRDDKTGMPQARTLAQNVKVTAIGMRHNPGDGDGGGHSITLLVTPAQAELIELACAVGRPRFALRGGTDLAMVDTKGVTFAELVGHHANRNDEFNTVVPVISTQLPSTQPSGALTANVTTRPSIDSDNDQWTIEVIRGGSESEAKFALPRDGNQFSDTNDPTR